MSTRNIRYDLPMNEPIVVGTDDIIVAGNVVGREDIIAVPNDKYTSDMEELALLRKEKDACQSAIRDMADDKQDVTMFSHDVWFPDDVELNYDLEDEDWQSDYWNPFDSHEPYEENWEYICKYTTVVVVLGGQKVKTSTAIL